MHTKKKTKMPTNIIFNSITGNQYKKLKHFEITYGMKSTKFGNCLMGLHDNCICYMSLFNDNEHETALMDMQADWPNATLEIDCSPQINNIIETIFDDNNQKLDINFEAINNYNVLLKGTTLQVKVWKELVTLKEGTTTNYEQIAKAVGNPKAVRAVANAIAKNRIAYLIPCHRVIHKKGSLSKYRWGPERKRQMLQYEHEKFNHY